MIVLLNGQRLYAHEGASGLELIDTRQSTKNLCVENVRATPVIPWGRIVIDYEVTGVLPTNTQDYVAIVTASNRTNGTMYTGGAVEGETALTLGAHRIWWNARMAGLRDAVAEVDVTVSYSYASMVEQMQYCVVDLSGGMDTMAYPISYLREVPSEGWTDEYKTTKLVLRRIEAGTFIMGDDQDDESHRVTLTKPFYLGVFEVTQKQWELVMGTWPENSPSSSCGRGDSYPAYYVPHSAIRGSSSGTLWPVSSEVDESSFLGRLRTKTGRCFDLPTEAQWEYACRAGSTASYYWGESMNDVYAWYHSNSGPKAHPVGTRRPNAWGLYDMSGGVWERCLDRYGNTRDYGIDPKGVLSGSYRVLRGGGWNSGSGDCTSAYRHNDSPSNSNYTSFDSGFRLSLILP